MYSAVILKLYPTKKKKVDKFHNVYFNYRKHKKLGHTLKHVGSKIGYELWQSPTSILAGYFLYGF